jgi:diguanylate cyclase (GGDEF)-like protein
MNRLVYPRNKRTPIIIVMVAFAIYVMAFSLFHLEGGGGIASLAIIPVISAGWYFGTRGGFIMSVLSILSGMVILAFEGQDVIDIYLTPGNIVGIFSLFLIALVVGRLATSSRERREALIKLEQYESERKLHTAFLEKLNEITALALEADSLKVILEILTEQIAQLFQADDTFFAFWDETLELPFPAAAYGSMSDTYPSIQYEPGDVTPATSAIKAGHPIAIEDIKDSPYISPRVAAMFPCHSMLGIPLIARRNKLGAILLGYNNWRRFEKKDILRAQAIADQVALVLSKSRLLEDERKQVRRLTALHDVAVTSIGADNENELIERVTDIIGNNLYPDNFGIMTLEEGGDVLRPHSSYRFYNTEKLELKELSLGTGITGQTALTGQSHRIGNVRLNKKYIIMDERTVSELCVPIKFKEKVLGVINAESTKRDAFSDDDERLLVTLAGQLATAIEQLRRAEAERKWMNQLAHSNGLIYFIAQITTQVDRSMTTDEIIQSLGKELEKIGLTCILADYNNERESFTVSYTSLEPHLLSIVEAGLGYPLLEYTFPQNKIPSLIRSEELLRPAIVQDPELEIKALFTHINPAGVKGILQRIGVTEGIEPMRLPLVFEKKLIGLLWVWGKELSRSDLPIMSIFAKQLGISLERSRLFQEVQSLALTDPLTHLQNRRSVFELGRLEFSRAQRMDRPFCCMMIDLDHFKKINDNYGHQVGDQVLQEFAKRCLHSVREVDLVGRYGGEEFIVLMPETARDMAVQVAERLRSTVTEKPFKTVDGEINLTISIGVASKDENTPHLETLVARADQALYIAKHKGRNRVAISV